MLKELNFHYAESHFFKSLYFSLVDKDTAHSVNNSLFCMS